MNRKIKIIIGIVVVFLFVIAVSIIGSQQKKPTLQPIKITTSTPANSTIDASVFSPVNITFNQAVVYSNISISSDPAETWSVSQVNLNSINAKHALYFKNGTDYRLTIYNNGEVVGIIAFKTETPQNDPRQLQQLKAENDRDYPLASLTPYETANFRVVYSAPMTFEIDLKANISSQNAISQVQTWVKSNGVDPSTHTYNVVPKK